jgi:hypothetical protein
MRCYNRPSRHGLGESCVRADQTLGEHKRFEAPIELNTKFLRRSIWLFERIRAGAAEQPWQGDIDKVLGTNAF